jgi:hypothetical protein
LKAVGGIAALDLALGLLLGLLARTLGGAALGLFDDSSANRIRRRIGCRRRRDLEA